LSHVLLAAILHNAGSADHFQVSDFCQLGQNVVLNAVGKDRMLFPLAEIFKWQYGDASPCRRPKKFTFPNIPTDCCCQSNQRCNQRSDSWITSQPSGSSGENPCALCLNRLVL